MPQCVRSSTTSYNADSLQAPTDYCPQGASSDRPNGSYKCEEESTFRSGRTDVKYVTYYCLPDALGKGVEMRPARFGTSDAQYLVLPVKIVQSQHGNFAGSQTVSDQQHQDGAVAFVDCVVGLGSCEKTLNNWSGNALWHRLIRVKPWRHDRCGHARQAPATVLRKAKECAKTLRVIVYCSPTTVPVGTLRRNSGVDVGDPDRSQWNIACRQPVEELIGSGPATCNCIF